MGNKAIVIGAGIAGIASAIRLAVKSYDVTVYEAFENAGGKLNQHIRDGFRFDRGPSLFTLPHLVDELFELCGEKPEAYFTYSRLKNTCKYFFEDGCILNAWSDVQDFGDEISSKTNDKANTLFRFLQKSRFLFDVTSIPFLFSSFSKVQNYFTSAYFKAFINLPRINALRSMHSINAGYFRDARLVQLFDRYATYNGSNPYKAPATLNVISHLEHNTGAFLPDKGMYSITESLVKLAEKQGVRFVYNSRVEKILHSNGKVKGVRLADHQADAEVVVSDSDITHLYKNLLPDVKMPQKLVKGERSTSALIFYWGIKSSFPELELHNILFSQDYENEFTHLFKEKEICEDPTVYIFISCKQVKRDAPEGCENWFVMVNAPENTGQDWDGMIIKARQNIKAKINRMLHTNIDDHILFEDILDPLMIEKRTSSYHGSLYGNSSNNRMSAFSRHPNFFRKIRGLYFTGGSVHPGGGIPLCLASAKIAMNEVKTIETNE